MSPFRKYNFLLLAKSALLLFTWHFKVKFYAFESWKSCLHPPHQTSLIESSLPVSAKSLEKEKQTVELQTALNASKHIDVVVRHSPLEFNCMRRCLALKQLLQQKRIYPQLHIGVKFDDDQTLAAHSWLSLHGNLINDSAENIHSYTELTNNENLEQYVQTM